MIVRTKREEDRHDRDILLAHRRDNGGVLWSSADGRWGVGNPFSTLDCGLMLHELGVANSDPLMTGIADLIFACQAEDGRFRPGPHLASQPCHTASAARLLCRLGHARDRRLSLTFEHLLATGAPDGGWRCSVLKFGAGPDTDLSNPGVTLGVLDAMRFRRALLTDAAVERAVDTLLAHWRLKRPLGPCRFGIGSRFMRPEYPFLRYNLFNYVFVLSFYPRARESAAFAEALAALEATLLDGETVIGYTKPGLKMLEFCREGMPSPRATRRYREIRRNLAQAVPATP